MDAAHRNGFSIVRPFYGTPKLLLAASGFFLLAAFFAFRFPDVPGTSIGSYLSTVAMAAPALVALIAYMGAKRGVAALLSLSIFAFAIETFGVATGFPYGDFSYGDALGGKLFGLTPYILPVSYVPLVLASVAASWRVSSRASLIPLSALLLTVMDGVLDPGATTLGFWMWPDGGLYYGVPASNYLGWLISGLLAATLLVSVGKWDKPPSPGILDGALLSLAFWVGVAVFGGLWIPAVLGVVVYFFLLRRRTLLRSLTTKTRPPRVI